jgi:hypothetical protein
MDGRSHADTMWSVSSLLGEYCATIDSGRYDEFAELFVADGRLEVPTAVLVGREQLTRFASKSPRGVHVGGTPFISAEAERIRSVCSFTFIDLDTGAQLVGYYHDDVVWADGRHRFRARRIEMHTPPQRR